MSEYHCDWKKKIKAETVEKCKIYKTAKGKDVCS